MAKPAKTTVVAEEAIDDKKGLSFEDGIVLSTTLLLLIAVVLAYVQYTSFYSACKIAIQDGFIRATTRSCQQP